MKNLCRIEKSTILWARAKWEREATELRDCEMRLGILMLVVGGGFGFGSNAIKDEVIMLEGRRKKLLGEMEVTWRLKSQAFWLQCGDENT